MPTLQVFDKPMCCSTGVCGPQVDPVLPRFAADLAWLEKQGVAVARFNLAHQPLEFVKNPDVTAAIQSGGEGVLPLLRWDGRILSRGDYPSRQQLAAWCGLPVPGGLDVLPANACGPQGCC